MPTAIGAAMTATPAAARIILLQALKLISTRFDMIFPENGWRGAVAATVGSPFLITHTAGGNRKLPACAGRNARTLT